MRAPHLIAWGGMGGVGGKLGGYRCPAMIAEVWEKLARAPLFI